MTGTLDGMSPPSKEPSAQPSRVTSWTLPGSRSGTPATGVSLTGPVGLLKALTKTVIRDRARCGVDLDGHKDILGMWAGDGDGESARFCMAVLTELRKLRRPRRVLRRL